ncbi:methyl-accepting chemotaxis protein [Halorussus halobius]|uniref:methyl-accepting chemotaxis protein n=1 Tax=Halorussus halobius TaxID=1710537 RepID=UPI001092B5B1|nr:methyl-accepting chemotaxis protein [Halorussus halobius]
MKIRTKLVVLLLAISLVPVSAVGVVGLQNMQQLGTYAQDESAAHLERQITSELNTTVDSRHEELENLLDARRIDALTLANSTPMRNYEAASAGEMELTREQNQQQVGRTALQLHDTVETTRRTILDVKYDGREWAELSAAEQRQVKDEVERRLFGTDGDGVAPNGTLSAAAQPGYVGSSGYTYVTDLEGDVVAHHDLEDGYNLLDDAGLTMYSDVQSSIRSTPAVRNGSEWGVAEYDWEDTTQTGNPTEEKFIAYTYHEEFDWVIAPNVYYYELQTAAVEDARSGISESFRSYLNERSVTVQGGEAPAYDEIVLTDDTGQGVIRTVRDEAGEVSSQSVENTSYADEAWFGGAESLGDGEVYVGDVEMVDGRQMMYIATPVYHDGEFAGVVSLRFNFSIISGLTNTVTVAETGHLTLVNADGRVLSHPDRAVVGTNIGDESYAGALATVAQNRILAGETGLDTYTRSEDDGEHGYYVSYAPLEFSDREYALLATAPEEDVNAPALALGEALSDRTETARNVVLLLLGGILVVVLGLGYKAAEYFSTPIEGVRDRATALAEGRFDEEIEVDAGDDEIGELVDAFDEMQGNLRRQVDELRSVSRGLGEGELDQDVDTDLPGEYGAIMTDIEEGIDRLQTGFGEIRRASRNVKAGELDQDVDTDLPGEYGAVLADLESGVDQLGRSFDRIRDASQQLRDGRLDQDLDDDLPGQYGEVMADLDAGLAEVERSLAEVKDLADQFAGVSDQTATSAEEIDAASQETAESVEEIAYGAERQTEKLQTAAGEMNDLSATIEEVASSADGVVDTASEAAALADRGREHAADATEEIAAIESEADAAVGQVEGLEDQIKEINEIVGLITEIAEQTNLLALNASIEAARAGEAGEGFAVVADEIKQLASEAGDATDEVEELIDEIQDSADDTVGDMRSMQRRVETGSETIEDAIDMFDDIADVAEEAEHGVEEISDAADDQAVSTEQVVAMVDEVSSVSQQTAAEASTVSSATEEQTAAINDVSRNVKTVSESARTLKELVDQFEVRDAEASVGAEAESEVDPDVEADSEAGADPDVGPDPDADIETDSEFEPASPVADGGRSDDD